MESNSKPLRAPIPCLQHLKVEAPGPAPPKAEPKAEAPREPASPVAVLVCHGMGQQVPFETLEAIANSVLENCPSSDLPRAIVRMVEINGQQLPRAELKLPEQEVHFYEAYWAPLTEGKVTARDSTWFLLMAALRGIRGSVFRRFNRWMFGGFEKFRVAHHLFILADFFMAFLALAALAVMNAVVVAAAASHTLVGNANPWPSGELLYRLTGDLAFYEITAFAGIFFAILLPLIIRWVARRCGCRFSMPAVIRLFLQVIVIAVVVATIVAGGTVFLHLFRLNCPAFDNFTAWLERPSNWMLHLATAKLHGLRLLFVWFLSLVIAFIVRWFLREYVGDVAAYVSSYSVSKFNDLRKAIQQAALNVFQPVYEARAEGSDAFLYQSLVVVGHSLGSVIAYDTLNKLINEEAGRIAVAPPAKPTPAAPKLRIAERTFALVTFGSPLDKTAFIFRNQHPDRTPIREALAAAKQPMILDYDYRPQYWTNLYSPADWISGKLRFYDRNEKPSPDKKVENDKKVHNYIDPEACIPLAAHTEYWTSSMLSCILWKAIRHQQPVP